VAVDRVNGTHLPYDVAGDGSGLVLIHGSWGDRSIFDELVPHLSAGLRVVTYDRRGHGESTAPPDEGTLHDDIADAAALIENLGIAPAFVAGTSSGANIAVRLAAARPDVVGKVAAHDPVFWSLLDASPDTKALAEGARRSLDHVGDLLEAGDYAGAAKAFVEGVSGPGAWNLTPPSMKEKFVRNAPTVRGERRDGSWETVPDLEQVAAPVLLTVGENSPPVCAAIVDALFNQLANSCRETIAGAGHVPQITHPSEYALLLRAFFQSG
jgi:pimeloyl-ACP methyl ester carboxylesterase